MYLDSLQIHLWLAISCTSAFVWPKMTKEKAFFLFILNEIYFPLFLCCLNLSLFPIDISLETTLLNSLIFSQLTASNKNHKHAIKNHLVLLLKPGSHCSTFSYHLIARAVKTGLYRKNMCFQYISLWFKDGFPLQLYSHKLKSFFSLFCHIKNVIVQIYIQRNQTTHAFRKTQNILKFASLLCILLCLLILRISSSH